VGLPKRVNQLVSNKQLVQLTTQTTLPEKTLEECLRDISTQVLETKYVNNLRQLLRIMPTSKDTFKNRLSLFNQYDLNLFNLNLHVQQWALTTRWQ